jgi:flagellar assembly factor FliW
MLDFINKKSFEFKGSILGFENLNHFTISQVEEGDSAYAYLQSSEDENTGFLVISPFAFFKDYTFEIEEKDRTLIDAQVQDEVAVLTIVTLREPFHKSTTNLLAPLIVNVRNGLGRQIVLPPKSNFSTKVLLIAEEEVGSGDSAC